MEEFTLYCIHGIMWCITLPSRHILNHLQSLDAGSKVISFPRCLLVRLVECLDKHSLSLSVLSGDIGSVNSRRKSSVN